MKKLRKELPYNPDDKNSIIEYAINLRQKTLRQACDEEILEHSYSGKGNFGQVLEKFYFFYEPNSDSEPDFPIAGLELKSTPLKILKNQEYRSKERLSLNIINFFEIVEQEFESSSFWKKNANLLLVIYLHKTSQDILDYEIKIVDEWEFPEIDLEIIKKDWELIKEKVAVGKAHELSEGDTFYLGACTKGGKGGNPRKQPNSDIFAKQRGYSLKQGYVNHIIATITKDESDIYGKLIKSAELARKNTIEEIVTSKFSPYFNLTINQIAEKTNIKFNPKAKNAYASLIKSILGIELNKQIEEFEKAEIVVKTIRVEEDNSIEQSVSFPAFEFVKIYNENWNQSEFKELLERKFLFVFLKKKNDEYILERIKFWNMPFCDRQGARKVWIQTKKVIKSGKIIKEVKIDKNGNTKRLNYFPNKSENPVAHVRPHGSTAMDTFPLPVPEKYSNKMEFTKQCFWLNWDYVRNEIYLK